MGVTQLAEGDGMPNAPACASPLLDAEAGTVHAEAEAGVAAHRHAATVRTPTVARQRLTRDPIPGRGARRLAGPAVGEGGCHDSPGGFAGRDSGE